MRLPTFSSREPKPKPLRENMDIADLHAGHKTFYRHIRMFTWFFGLGLVFIACLWLVFRSPLFKLREFVIVGASEVSEEEIIKLLESRAFRDSKLSYTLGWRNMLMWPRELTAKDLELLPTLSEVAIIKDYDKNRIEVHVKEKTFFGIWCSEQSVPAECSWFDQSGTVTGRAPDVLGNIITRVGDYASPPKRIGEKIISSHFLPNLFSIFYVLQKSGLGIEEIRIDNLELQELLVRTREGPQLYFSLRLPANATLAVINSLRQSKRESFNSFEYVDFRVENRAYYR